MLRTYLKIAWRNWRNQRFYTLINTVGLALGLTSFLFIFLYVNDELSFDRSLPNADRVYRFNFMAKLGDELAHTAASPKPAGPEFMLRIPEIETFCRLRKWGGHVVHLDNQSFNEEVVYADSTFFRVFPFQVIAGDPRTALESPSSVVLTRRAAEKYFGDEEALGQRIKIGDDDLQVTAVMQDLPKNMHYHFDFFRSMSGLNLEWDNDWGSTNYYNYFLLRKGADPKEVSRKATEILDEHLAKVIRDYLGTSWEDFTAAGNYANAVIFPVKDIHLHSNLEDELSPNSDSKYIAIFGIIGLFILGLACINFMNLSSARSTVRAKEVGVRKTLGARRGELASQFLFESSLMSLLALLLTFIAAPFLLPYFNVLAGKQLESSILLRPSLLAEGVLFALLIGLVAGSYPALLLSRFHPVQVLKSNVTKIRNASGWNWTGSIRSALVVFQFVTTTVLLVGALVVSKQLHFIQNKKLGFNKEHVLVLHDPYLAGDNMSAFKEQLLQWSDVTAASVSGNLPVNTSDNSGSTIRGRVIDQEHTTLSNNWWVDFDYVKTMGLEIVAGRDFSTSIRTDSSAVIINETMARRYGYPQKDVIGQEVNFIQDEQKLDIHTIVGVVRDFNFASLHDRIEPLALFRGVSRSYLSIRLNTDNLDHFIHNLQDLWERMAPSQPFVFSFMDERFNALYESEIRIGNITNLFAFLAILIACMGLLGLATFTVQQRTREIGIRKVLGASVQGIVVLLSGEFLKLVILALVIATPIAWIMMHRWLEDFAYRIAVPWWAFLLAGIIAISVAFFTISFNSIRAALANPTKSLHNE